MTVGKTFRIAIIGKIFLLDLNLIYHLFHLGGGPAGLSLAIGLKQKGFENLIVYEREKSIRKRFLFIYCDFMVSILIDDQIRHQGWSISLFSPNGGLAFIEQLGLLSEFSAISFQPCFRALDGETGLFIF